ncbi:MAG: hypothetical protein LBT30_07650, partial [Clostridiales bacterium]|nr:hypothetical protein [Clostridiales bacterium]MDR3264166.1 hypothetical protein [Clostridiales bacterium]
MVGGIIALSLAGALAVILAFMIIRTLSAHGEAAPNNSGVKHGLDKDLIAAHLSGAVRIPTVSMSDGS